MKCQNCGGNVPVYSSECPSCGSNDINTTVAIFNFPTRDYLLSALDKNKIFITILFTFLSLLVTFLPLGLLYYSIYLFLIGGGIGI